MEIRCPNTQRNGALGADFVSVGVADPGPGPMPRQLSLPPAMMTRQVSWTAPLSKFSSLASSKKSSGSQAAYIDASSSGGPDESSRPAGCSSDLMESSSREGAIASSIADTVIDLLKKQLDGLNTALIRETEKLLKSANTRSPTRIRTTELSFLSKVPNGLEEEGASPPDSESLVAPDGSLVPIPVWAPARRHISQEDMQPHAGQKCSSDQPLPSVVVEASADECAQHMGEKCSFHQPLAAVVEEASPNERPLNHDPSLNSLQSKRSAKRVHHLAVSEFQREMQRAAVITRGRTEDCAGGTLSSAEHRRPQRLPKSVTGAWRRQAAILGRKFREDMEEEVQWQKTENNMSFYGGLWWLRQITGVRSMSKPRTAACVSSCNILLMIAILSWHLQIAAAVPGNMLSSVLDVAMIASSALALTIHHACCKLSENCPTTGEQDAILQSHAVAFGSSGEWLALSRKQGRRLLCIWLASNAAACASYIYKAQVLPESSRNNFIVTGSLFFTISSTTICSLSMRVAHICAAMKISLISYMQQFANFSVDFYDMVQEWNAVQIFIRTLSDGCAPSLACQVAMIPVMVVSALLQMILTNMPFLEVSVTITPFFLLSGMSYFALVCAADTSMQCEQAAQVANSLLVGQLDNPVAKNLLDFMQRCSLGFFINDLRISPAGVMKYTYVLVGVFVTVASSVGESRM